MRNNYLEVVGNLGNDPKIGQTKTDSDQVIISVAVSNFQQDKNTGEWLTKDPDWLDLFCYGRAAEKAKLLKKGERVRIIGQVKTWTSTNNQGQKINNLKLVAKSIEYATTIRTNLTNVTDDEILESFKEEVSF